MFKELHVKDAAGRIGSSQLSFSGLHVCKSEPVVPLDQQLGVWPTRCIPLQLQNALFNLPSKTEAEHVKAMPCHAVLDATQIFGLPDLLESAGLPARCLYTGAAAHDFADAAPYLVELPFDHPFTRRVFTAPDCPGGLWRPDMGIFLHSEALFTSLWTHLRRFTRVRGKDGKFAFFRFWDPRVLGDYLLSIDSSDDPILTLLCADNHLVRIVTATDLETLRFDLAEPGTCGIPSGPIVLDSDRLAGQAAVRIISTYAMQRGIPVDKMTIAKSGYDFRRFSDIDLKIVTLLHGHFRISSRYDPDHYPELAELPATYSKPTLDQVKTARLKRLEFFMTQGVDLGM